MSFKNILGHEAAIRLIKGQISRERLASTYLFAGPTGIGKKTLALELAKALECSDPSEAGACDGCESCLKIGQGTFPDVMEVKSDKESGQLGIDQVRVLANWMALTSFSGKWKVGIVDNADLFTEQAAHACLKLLEEPPPKGIILLIAAAPQRLPSTLVSRCHLVRCAPQGISRTAAYLAEKGNVEPRQADLLAAASGGRLGLALEFHQQGRLDLRNKGLNLLLAAWRQKGVESPLGTAPRAEIEESLEWLASWWRDLLVLKLDGDPRWLVHQDKLEELRAAQADVETEELIEWIDTAYGAQESIQRNASPRIALAALLSCSAEA